MTQNVFDILKERGFVQQATDEDAIRHAFGEGPVSVYVGYDPTADSLHVGHLFTLMSLVHLQRAGHRPIALLGGGTAMVGDPSGKSELRQMLSREQIEANIEAFRVVFEKLLGGPDQGCLIVDNSEWLLGLEYIAFLREIGRHFSVNRMLSAEAYKLRLERGLSFIEFNYQLLQAYDFLQLRRKVDCRLQMGGDDQWGNILAGVDLCRRVDQELVQGLTFPLLLTATGQKMGKTEAGAVWLDPEKLSPYNYYQHWVNTHDNDVGRMLGFFTFLPMKEIQEAASLEGADLNVAKSILAYEATAFVHGEMLAQDAHRAAQAAFGGREIPAAILPSSTLPRAAGADITQMPSTEIFKDELQSEVTLVDMLARVGLAKSKSEARRLIKQNAVRVNDERQSDEKRVLSMSDFQDDRLTLRVGKKKVHQLVLS